MKALSNRILLALLVIFTLAAVGCEKGDDPKPTPPKKNETTLSVVADPALVPFGENTTITITSNAPVTLSDGTSVGTSLTISKIVRDTTLTFIARGESGNRTVDLSIKVKYPEEKFIGIWKLKEAWGFSNDVYGEPFYWKQIWKQTGAGVYKSFRFEYLSGGIYIERNSEITDVFPDTKLPVYPITTTWKFETDAKGRLILNTAGRKEVIEFLPDGTVKLLTELTPTPTPDSPSLFRDSYSIYERATL